MATRWRSLSGMSSAATAAAAAAATNTGTGRCAVYATKRGVSGNCKFERTSAVKPSWDSLNKKTAKLEQKLDAVDGTSFLALGGLDTTTVPGNTDVQLITWKHVGSTNCLSSSSLITIGGDQFVRVRSHGLYTVTCQLRWTLTSADVDPATAIIVYITVNGGINATGTYHPAKETGANSFANCIITSSLMLNAGDEIRVFARQNTSGTQTVSSTNGTVWTVQKH